MGIDVFDRDETFDPTIDSIVRVEAGRLRSKLTEYYSNVGRDDTVKIELPKGGYAASIQIAPDRRGTTVAKGTSIYRNKIAALFVGLLVIGAVVGSIRHFLTPQEIMPPGTGANDASGVQRGGRVVPAIAILPFDNLSGESEQEYFSDGITEDIITDLSILSGLKVIARHSTFVYKNKAVSIREVGRKLNVSHVLEGSVRKAGDRVRITAQLIDVETDSHIWADRYDRHLGDVFAIQEEVSKKIVGALEIALTKREEERLVHRATKSIEAHDAFLRGKEQFYRFDAAAVRRSIDLFTTAIERDSSYAEAYAWKSRALVYSFVSGFNPSKEGTVDKALDLARRSIALDDMLPMAHANLAWAQRWNKQIDEAVNGIARAVEIDPNFAEAYLWQSLILSTAGRGEEALEAINRSIRLNPNYGVTSIFAFGRANFALGNLATALDHFNRGIKRNPSFLPNHTFKVFTLELMGNPEAAEIARKDMAEVKPDYARSASYRYFFDENPRR